MADVATGRIMETDGPGIFDALRGDPTFHFDRHALRLLETDQGRWSYRFLRPLARLMSRLAVAVITSVKRVLPFQFSNHDLLDRLGIWFLSHFVSEEGGELLLRHFVIETNVLAFIAANTGHDQPTLRPGHLDDLDDNAVIVHDLNLYQVLSDLDGRPLTSTGVARLLDAGGGADRGEPDPTVAPARPGDRDVHDEHRLLSAHHLGRVPEGGPLPPAGRVGARHPRRADRRLRVPDLEAGRVHPHRPHQPGRAP